MINKQQITQMAKRVLGKKNTLQKPQIMRPAREWGTGLLVGMIIFIASAGWSAQTYIQYRNTAVTETSEKDINIVVYRESLVQAALEELKKRSEIHANLLSANSQEPVVVSEELGQAEESEDETATSSFQVSGENTSPTGTDSLEESGEVVSEEEAPVLD